MTLIYIVILGGHVLNPVIYAYNNELCQFCIHKRVFIFLLFVLYSLIHAFMHTCLSIQQLFI